MTFGVIKIRVGKVRSANPRGFGGCIFSGRSINNDGDVIDAKNLYVVVLSHKILGATPIHPGQWWEVSGDLVEQTRILDNYKFTECQIEATKATLVRISGEHIVEFLSSKEFVGIGRTKARRLWNKFGEELYPILDNGQVEPLLQVLTEKSVKQVIECWASQGHSRTLQWLHQHGFDISVGKQLVQFFGKQAQEKIEEDPYRLLSFCANWKVVDALARTNFSINDDDPRRMKGAVEEALYRMFATGHTATKMNLLERHLRSLLGPNSTQCDWMKLINEAIDVGCSNGSYIIAATDLIHPLGPFVMELTVARAIERRLKSRGSFRLFSDVVVDKIIAEYETSLPFPLTGEQRKAIHLANGHSVALIVGGAGVGKTTVLQTLNQIYDAAGYRVFQIALAGRAAKRIQEATRRPASTIASFLQHVKASDLTGDTVVIIDESSMVDIITMSRLCEALPDHVRLVLTGDQNQLMPVGPGLVLHSLINVPGIPVVELTAVKRYGGKIAAAAKAIRSGNWPCIQGDENEEISFISCEKSRIAGVVAALYDRDPANSQILTLRRTGHDGSKRLNELCQERYTKSGPHLMVWSDEHEMDVGTGFYLNDLVICTRNRWDLGVQNGSLGKLVEVENEPRPVKDSDGKTIGKSVGTIEWDDGVRRPIFEEFIDDLELGFAITVHKAQGSQWPVVIVPLTKNRLLDRTMIYTAITRARSKVVIVGDPVAARAAVESPPFASRRSVGLEKIIDLILSGSLQ